jgi:hypothetical protein
MKTVQKLRKVYRYPKKAGGSKKKISHLNPGPGNPLFRIANHVQSHFFSPRASGGHS